MVASTSEAIEESDTLKVESIVSSLYSLFIFGLAIDWKYYLLFKLALGGILVILLFRVMARIAEDPNMDVIKKSLQWSYRLSQLALIGALAAITLYIQSEVGYLTPLSLFTILAFTLSLSFVLLDQLILREYTETWVSIIFEETGNDVVGQTLRVVAGFSKDQIEAVVNDKSTSSFLDNFKTLFLGMGLLSLILFVSLPVLLILSAFLGNWQAAILMMLSVVFLRDMTRYIYINYGPVSALKDLRWTLKYEFTWTLVMSLVLAGVLGYDLTIFIQL